MNTTIKRKISTNTTEHYRCIPLLQAAGPTAVFFPDTIFPAAPSAARCTTVPLSAKHRQHCTFLAVPIHAVSFVLQHAKKDTKYEEKKDDYEKKEEKEYKAEEEKPETYEGKKQDQVKEERRRSTKIPRKGKVESSFSHSTGIAHMD
jgi:hypothetical protein